MQVAMIHNMMKSRESLEWCCEALMNSEKIPKRDTDENGMAFQPAYISYRLPNHSALTRTSQARPDSLASPTRSPRRDRVSMQERVASPVRSGGRQSGASATGLFAAGGSPSSPRRAAGAGQESRDVRRHNSATLYDQVEGRAGPVGIFTLPRTHSPIKT